MAQYKIYKVAKELNLASTTIIEFLEGMGQSLPKGHMSGISEELYLEVLKKFNRAQWQALQEQQQEEKVSVKKKKGVKAREEELAKILAETSEVTLKKEAVAEEKVEPVTPQPEEAKAEEEIAEIEEEKEVIEEAAEKEIAEEKKEAVEEVSEAAAAEKAVTEAAVPDQERRKKKEEKKEYHPAPGTFEAMMRTAKREETVARARELAKAREKKTQVLTPEEAHAVSGEKRKLKRKKEETAEEAAIRKAVERAQKAARDRKREKVLPAGPVGAQAKKPVGRRRRRAKKAKVDQKLVEASIKQTLASMDEKRPRKRRRKAQEAGEMVLDDNVLRVTEFLSTNELAAMLEVPVSELIKKCLDMGLQVTINQRLDRDIIELLVGEYGWEVEFQDEFEGIVDQEEEEEEKPEDLQPRPPVVTVMGHVDHGKTSLLDYLRKSNIIAGESGGITQHIGAYSVSFQDKPITFLDTPGHEAFTAMRARGAQVTDLVVLIVAADDHVMPQTLEAINHAKAAGVPIIIAINKIDKPAADPDRIRRELSEQDILVEEWGGKYPCALLSAKTGEGVDNLLEEILLAAEARDLKANPDRKAAGVIIESRLDRGRGPLATVLIQKGVLKVGNVFVAGMHSGRVKAMFDEYGQKMKEVKPGFSVQVLGFDGTPQAGDSFIGMDSEKEVKAISLRRQALQREQTFKQIRALNLEGLSQRIKAGESHELPLVIKGDVNGSVEALSDSLMKLNSDEVGVKIIHRGVGAITETDVNLASASSALIIGFMVHPNLKARESANRQKVEIRLYRIIYDVVNDVKAALEGMLAPAISEKFMGTLEVRQTFRVPKIGTIAGCYVQSGKIERHSRVRLIRDGQQVYEGQLASLRRFKDDAREVAEGYECGVGIANFQDVKEGDVIEAFELVESKRTLA